MEQNIEFLGWDVEMEALQEEFKDSGLVHEIEVTTDNIMEPKRKLLLFTAYAPDGVTYPYTLVISKGGAIELSATTLRKSMTQEIVDHSGQLYEKLLKPAEERLSTSAPTDNVSESWTNFSLVSAESTLLRFRAHALDNKEWTKRKDIMLKPWREHTKK